MCVCVHVCVRACVCIKDTSIMHIMLRAVSVLKPLSPKIQTKSKLLLYDIYFRKCIFSTASISQFHIKCGCMCCVCCACVRACVCMCVYERSTNSFLITAHIQSMRTSLEEIYRKYSLMGEIKLTYRCSLRKLQTLTSNDETKTRLSFTTNLGREQRSVPFSSRWRPFAILVLRTS